MRGPVEVVLALVLVLLIRVSGGSFSLRKHPILGPFFKVDPQYLDSLVHTGTIDSAWQELKAWVPSSLATSTRSGE